MDDNKLRQEVMINQFINVCGGTRDQAHQVLSESKWNFDSALSLYLRETQCCPPPPNTNSFQPFRAPRNTPATPPNFPETLELFHKLHTSESIQQQPAQVPENAQVLRG